MFALLSPAYLAEAREAPYVPGDDTVIVERLPAGTSRAHQILRSVETDPADPAAAVELARRYLELGRVEGDPRLYGYAQAALAPWWDRQAPPAQVRLLRAVIRQARHEFSAALTDLDRILVQNPRNAQAWLTRAVILQVQGKPRLALRSCLRLLGLVPSPVPAACMAGAAGRMGRAEAALAALNTALAAARSEPQVLIWALLIQAELAERLDRIGEAEAAYRRALDFEVRDTRLLAAYTNFLLAQNRPAEVLTLLAGETRSFGLLLRLALAERRLGDPALADHLTRIRSYLETARLRGDGLHLREAAWAQLELFDDPVEALKLALRNWSVQREPADARLVLEAAVAAGDPASARPVLAWLRETGLRDRRFMALAARLEQPYHADF